MYMYVYVDKNVIGNWKYLVSVNNYTMCISIITCI